MAKLVVFEPFWGFFSISLDLTPRMAPSAQYQCPRLWEWLNAFARGGGWSLIYTPEAVGGASYIRLRLWAESRKNA